MRVTVYHASKYGNGARLAEEFRKLMAEKGNEVEVHHVSDMSPRDVPPADLYVFGSPTHFGKAPGDMIRFLKKLSLPPGTRYAVIATFSAAVPDKRTGKMPAEDELERIRRTVPMIDEQLKAKGMIKVAEMRAFVNPDTMKGPLLDGWQEKVRAFVAQILERT